MFESLELVPDDPILGLMAAYRADAHPEKIDLGVGVYRNARGQTPVLESVRRAERQVLEQQVTKTYVAPSGNPDFNQAMERLALGGGHPALAAGRVCTIQGVGGCGALRLGAELIRAAGSRAVVHVSSPTWANHVPLIGGSGLKLEPYPYYDPSAGSVCLAALLEALDALPHGSVVLFHACCHNPTGADLAEDAWREVLSTVKQRALLPFFDMAYQGLGAGIDADAFPVRLFAAELPELLVAVSCSKTFGLYRERAGTLHVLTESPQHSRAAASHLVRIARRLYSMPPDHGASIVSRILGDEALKDLWRREVNEMRERLIGLRRELVRALALACPGRDFSFLGAQRGLFSILGVSAEQVRTLKLTHRVYMTDDGRINVAGLRSANIEPFARAVAQTLA